MQALFYPESPIVLPSEYPICLHATPAATLFQPALHIALHLPLFNISILPKPVTEGLPLSSIIYKDPSGGFISAALEKSTIEQLIIVSFEWFLKFPAFL